MKNNLNKERSIGVRLSAEDCRQLQALSEVFEENPSSTIRRAISIAYYKIIENKNKDNS